MLRLLALCVLNNRFTRGYHGLLPFSAVFNSLLSPPGCWLPPLLQQRCLELWTNGIDWWELLHPVEWATGINNHPGIGEIPFLFLLRLNSGVKWGTPAAFENIHLGGWVTPGAYRPQNIIYI